MSRASARFTLESRLDSVCRLVATSCISDIGTILDQKRHFDSHSTIVAAAGRRHQSPGDVYQ